MKGCPSCKQTKSLTEFSKSGDGLQLYCRPCHSAGVYRTKKKYYEYYKLGRTRRRDKELATNRKYKKDHAGSVRAMCALRDSRERQSCPDWANTFFMREAYELSSLRTKLTGIKWHVDHIVPLQSKIVCGLHCERNLQVIPAVKNMSKKNNVWPQMP